MAIFQATEDDLSPLPLPAPAQSTYAQIASAAPSTTDSVSPAVSTAPRLSSSLAPPSPRVSSAQTGPQILSSLEEGLREILAVLESGWGALDEPAQVQLGQQAAALRRNLDSLSVEKSHGWHVVRSAAAWCSTRIQQLETELVQLQEPGAVAFEVSRPSNSSTQGDTGLSGSQRSDVTSVRCSSICTLSMHAIVLLAFCSRSTLC